MSWSCGNRKVGKISFIFAFIVPGTQLVPKHFRVCVYVHASVLNPGWPLYNQYLCWLFFFFFFFFFFFQLEDSYFAILYWFLPYISMNHPQGYICPLPLEPLSYLPMYPSPLLTEHQIELPASYSKFPLAICFTNGMYMFQCCSFNSSHPFLPRPCPPVSSLSQHLCCCPANRFINTIFLDSTSMH